jgi:drug/metabolite transporter (DMT)-like permease
VQPALLVEHREVIHHGGVVTYLVPVVALLLGVLVLSEPASLALPIGGVLILSGVALTRARSRTARPSP